MSLLLDALKRAEQEKSARGATTAANDAPRPAPGAKPTLELQPVASPAREPAMPKAEARDTAAAMMQARAPSARQTSKASIIWAIVGVAIVLIGAGVGYIWYAIQPVRTPATVGERKRPVTLPPIASGASIAPAVQASPTAGPRPPEVARLAPAPAPAADGAAHDMARDAAARETPDPQEIMANLLNEARARGAGPVKFSRSERSAGVSPEIRSAYAALAAGDLAAARRGYAAAVSADGSNLDALLGAATVEARRGDRDGARAYYRKVLEIDPRNATALAGLAATAESAAPAALETQLRAELARAPESAALHVTLGSLYASQSRWNEAQARFFDAYRLEPQSADIAFNLAVSLDHLGQPRLAAQYYTRALESAGAQAPQFETAAARRRLAELAR